MTKMAELDSRNKKLTIKLVYYGPACSGKTTNLMRLHDILNPSQCGELMAFETKGDRTLFFDFLPLMLTCATGLRIKFKLFTVPGQVAHDATRKAVLSRADGVVFVADSQESQAISNFESFDNLEKNCGRVGLDFDHLPLVIQFNKQDLNAVMSEPDILNRWEPSGLPVLFSSALYGRGVRKTFKTALTAMFHHLNDQYGLTDGHQVNLQDFLSVVPPVG